MQSLSFITTKSSSGLLCRAGKGEMENDPLPRAPTLLLVKIPNRYSSRSQQPEDEHKIDMEMPRSLLQVRFGQSRAAKLAATNPANK